MALCPKCGGSGRRYHQQQFVAPKPAGGYVSTTMQTWRRCTCCGGRRAKPCARWQIGPDIIGPGARRAAA